MDRYAMLKQRSAKCCCRYCGKPLEVRMVIYNKYGGTAPEIYNTAKDFIDAVDFNYFPELEDNDTTYQFNVAKVCDMLSWCCKDWGILDEHGFHLGSDGDENQE